MTDRFEGMANILESDLQATECRDHFEVITFAVFCPKCRKAMFASALRQVDQEAREKAAKVSEAHEHSKECGTHGSFCHKVIAIAIRKEST